MVDMWTEWGILKCLWRNIRSQQPILLQSYYGELCESHLGCPLGEGMEFN